MEVISLFTTVRLILTGWNIIKRRQGFGIGREIDLGKSLSPVVATAETTARQARFVSAIILHYNINDDWNQGHAVRKNCNVSMHSNERTAAWQPQDGTTNSGTASIHTSGQHHTS